MRKFIAAWGKGAAALGMVVALSACQSAGSLAFLDSTGGNKIPDETIYDRTDTASLDYSVYQTRRDAARTRLEQAGKSFGPEVEDPTVVDALGPTTVIQDAKVTARLEQEIDDILAIWPSADKPDINVVLLDGDGFAPSVTGGGTILIQRGLLEQTEYLDELQFVLAHEVAHVLLNHHAKEENEGRLAFLEQYGPAIMAELDQDSKATKYVSYASTASTVLRTALSPGWNRQQEREADFLAQDLMTQLQRSRNGGVYALERLVQLEAEAKALEPEGCDTGKTLLTIIGLNPDAFDPNANGQRAAQQLGVLQREHEAIQIEAATLQRSGAAQQPGSAAAQRLEQLTLRQRQLSDKIQELSMQFQTQAQQINAKPDLMTCFLNSSAYKDFVRSHPKVEKRLDDLKRYNDKFYGELDVIPVHKVEGDNFASLWSPDGALARSLLSKRAMALLKEGNLAEAEKLGLASLNGASDITVKPRKAMYLIRRAQFDQSQDPSYLNRALKNLEILVDAAAGDREVYTWLAREYADQARFDEALDIVDLSRYRSGREDSYLPLIVELRGKQARHTAPGADGPKYQSLAQSSLDDCLRTGNKPLIDLCTAAAQEHGVTSIALNEGRGETS